MMDLKRFARELNVSYTEHHNSHKLESSGRRKDVELFIFQGEAELRIYTRFITRTTTTVVGEHMDIKEALKRFKILVDNYRQQDLN